MKKVERTKATRKQARAWMLAHDIRMVDIQRALAMKNHNLVSDPLAGKRNNRRVLRYLVEIGCPVEYLDISKNVRKENEA